MTLCPWKVLILIIIKLKKMFWHRTSRAFAGFALNSHHHWLHSYTKWCRLLLPWQQNLYSSGRAQWSRERERGRQKGRRRETKRDRGRHREGERVQAFSRQSEKRTKDLCHKILERAGWMSQGQRELHTLKCTELHKELGHASPKGLTKPKVRFLKMWVFFGLFLTAKKKMKMETAARDR